MQKMIRYALLVMILCLVIGVGSALTVSIDKAPPTNLKIGDKVEATLKMFVESNHPLDHDVWISTDLKDATVQVFDVTDNTIPPLPLQVSYQSNPLIKSWIVVGFIIGGEDSRNTKIIVSGTVPDIQGTSNLTVVKVAEGVGFSEVRTYYTLSREVLNPAIIDSKIQEVETDLDEFKSLIDNLGPTGVDITAATQKYNAAHTSLEKAKNEKISDPSKVQTDLNSAIKSIEEGQNLLYQADVQHEINLADQSLNQVNELITYFTVNRSLSMTDSRLVPITTKYDIASSKISDAKTSLNNKDYIGAKAKATESLNTANEAYDLSVALKSELGEGLALPGINPLFLALGAGIIVIGVIGYFAYRKFFHWDELG